MFCWRYIAIFLIISFCLPVFAQSTDCPTVEPININTANATDLDSLHGVGPAKASDIISYRNTNGYFLKTVDIQKVSGIGPATFENIKLCITVGSETATETKNETNKQETNEEANQSDINTATISKQSSDKYESVIRGPLSDDFSLSIKAPTTVYVNQRFVLDAIPKNVSDRYTKKLDYIWSFGDGQAGYKQYMSHTYKYPGTYVVVLKAKYRRSEQIARHTITVLPVNFSITRNTAGDIQVNNDAKYEINLTGYQVIGVESVKMPENTILLPGSTITVPQSKLALSGGGLVRLVDEQGQTVASTLSTNVPQQNRQNNSISTVTDEEVAEERDFNFADKNIYTTSQEEGNRKESVIEVSDDKKSSLPPNSWPYLGLISLLVVSTFGVLYKS